MQPRAGVGAEGSESKRADALRETEAQEGVRGGEPEVTFSSLHT